MPDADAHVIERMYHLRAEAESVAASLAFALRKRVGERAFWTRVDPAGMHRDNDSVPLLAADTERGRLTVRMWRLRDELSDVTRRLRALPSED